MNPLTIKLIFAGVIALGGYGLYYLIGENARLEKDNETLVENVKDTQEAIFNLGQTVTDLNIKYSEATNNEFKKFNESDISKVEMGKLVRSFNVGTKRVFRDYKNSTTKFIRGDTKTTSP